MGELLESVLSSVTEDDVTNVIVKDYMNRRCLIINEEIDACLFEYFSLKILQWNREDKDKPVEKRKKIYVFINCDGGEVIIGLHMIDMILHSVTPVVTVGFAKCASMASYLLMAGKERYCFPNTVILLHDGQTGYVTSANKGRDVQKFYDAIADRTNQFMLEHTKMSPDFLESIKDREYYLWPDEGKELGIVDKIIGVDCQLDEILGE